MKLYIIFNIVTFLIVGLDKFASKKGYSIMNEDIYFILAIIEGGVGVVLGMIIFRHIPKSDMHKVLYVLCAIMNLYILYLLH